MRQNLDTLKTEIPAEIVRRKLVVFPAFSRAMEQTAMVYWDTEKHPDYREFLGVAEQAGAKLVVFHDRQFSAEMVEDAIERLEECQMPRDEQRALDRRLRELRVYDGFTCGIELSFTSDGAVYLFELQTEWYDELHEMLDDIDAYASDDDEDEDEGPIGGYFSKN
jgi:hypothetical protein